MLASAVLLVLHACRCAKGASVLSARRSLKRRCGLLLSHLRLLVVTTAAVAPVPAAATTRTGSICSYKKPMQACECYLCH